MSCMRCIGCDHIVDTDLDSESLYVKDMECWCEHCRDELDLETEFDREDTDGRLIAAS